jgi:hypothetical protein
MTNLSGWRDFLNTIEQEGSQKVHFGRYKNKTFAEVITDKHYCAWIRQQTPNGLEMFVLKQFVEKIHFLNRNSSVKIQRA